MIRNYIITLAIIMISMNLLAQRVTTVVAAVKNDKVLIGYQIKGLRCEQSVKSVSFYVSRDGGQNYTGPLNYITGDFEDGVRNGKHIVEWDALKEMPFSDERLVFDVRVEIDEKRRKRAIMLSYIGNATTPLGGRFGQLGKVSWYLEGRSSLLAGRPIDYEYSGNSVFGYNLETDSVSFTGNEGWKAYSAVVGATFQTSCNFFFYLGIGYGYEEYIKEFDMYNQNTGAKTGTYWAKDPDRTLQGVEMDGGIIYRYKALVFTGGVTLLNLNNYNWTVGFGVAF
jgi:hypothetical protein